MIMLLSSKLLGLHQLHSYYYREKEKDNAGNVASYLKYALSRARSFSLMAVASGLPISL